MDLHLALDRARPLRMQVEDELRARIRSGRLRPDARIPSSRDLAEQLGVSRGIIVEAYAQLAAEGYLATHGGGGTRVTRRRPVEPARAVERPAVTVRFDLRTECPDVALFPRREWAAALTDALRELPVQALSYGPGQGLPALREALGDYLGRVRSLSSAPRPPVVTCGAGHALELALALVRAHGGRRVAYEDPAWRRIPASIRRADLAAVAVGVDENGLRTGSLAAAGVDAVVVSPAHQYPTGAVLSQPRRGELLAWARAADGLIIEDDFGADYRRSDGPSGALQASDPDRVAYIGTASKALAPALRLGWLTVPASLAGSLATLMDESSAQPSVIDQAAYARLLQRGHVDRHLRRARQVYRERAAVLEAALAARLPGARVTGQAAGLHVCVWLAAGADDARIAAAAAQRGVAVESLSRDFAHAGAAGPALVLGYGAIEACAIPRAIDVLADCLAG